MKLNISVDTDKKSIAVKRDGEVFDPHGMSVGCYKGSEPGMGRCYLSWSEKDKDGKWMSHTMEFDTGEGSSYAHESQTDLTKQIAGMLEDHRVARDLAKALVRK